MVWMRDGNYWTRCFIAPAANLFNTAGTGYIACSQEFVTDSVVYVGNVGGTDVWYSANAGQSWSRRTCNEAVNVIAAVDATTVYVGENNPGAATRVAKSTNSGWTWPTSLRKATGTTGNIVDLKVKGSTVIVGQCRNGTALRRWRLNLGAGWRLRLAWRWSSVC